MKITFFGTTTLLFDDGKTQILFDAHFTRPSLFKMLFGRLKTDEKNAESLLDRFCVSRLSAVFVSHTHYDHVLDAPFVARKTNSFFCGTESALNVARGGGVREEKLKCFEDSKPISFGDFSVTALQSLHSRAKWFNNDIGKKITAPLEQPASRRDFCEGGSFDFLIENAGRRFLIRPSFSVKEGEFDFLGGKSVDALFLGIAGLAEASEKERAAFFSETTEKLQAKNIIPIHWDNFFIPLNRPTKPLPALSNDIPLSLKMLAESAQKSGSSLLIQLPLSSIEL